MNKVVKAENEKVAAIDFATATETHGRRRSGAPRSRRPRASSRPRSSRPRARPRRSSSSTRPPTSTSSATPSCCAGSRRSRRALSRTAKIVVPRDTELVNVIGDIGGHRADGDRRRRQGQERTRRRRREEGQRNQSICAHTTLTSVSRPRPERRKKQPRGASDRRARRARAERREHRRGPRPDDRGS